MSAPLGVGRRAYLTILRGSEHNAKRLGRRRLATSPGCGHRHLSEEGSRETFITGSGSGSFADGQLKRMPAAGER